MAAQRAYQRALAKDLPDANRAQVWSNVAALYRRRERLGEVEPALRIVIALRRQALGDEHAGRAVAPNARGIFIWPGKRYRDGSSGRSPIRRARRAVELDPA